MMPTGKIHYSWWKRFLGLAAFLSFAIPLYTLNVWDGVLVFAGYILGRWIDPDLDQISITSSEGRMMREFGIFGVLMAGYWMPYAYLIPHRSWISHMPGISTIIRLLYLLAIPFSVAVYMQFKYGNNDLMSIMLYLLGYLFIGLALSDSVHYILDVSHK